MRAFTRFSLLALSAFTLAVGSLPSAAARSEDDFDRLDGRGPSGKKVDVIEWEGNLEIHVSPAGSLKGLGLKLDDRDQKKPVMVISYRFDNTPKAQKIIRRAILGVPIREGFNAYLDKTADEYDKVLISNQGLALSNTLVKYALDPEPKQMYPDGHPALASQESGPPGNGRNAMASKDRSTKTKQREPAASALGHSNGGSPQDIDQDTGTIRPFHW